jgi:hypothetical protein
VGASGADGTRGAGGTGGTGGTGGAGGTGGTGGAGDDLGPSYAGARGCSDGGEPGWRHPETRGRTKRTARSVENAAYAAVEAQETGGVEADEAGTLGLDGRAHRLEPDKQALPSVGNADGVGWDEHQTWAARECLAEAHAGMDAEGFGGEGNLAYFLGCARLWGEGGWGLK